MACYILHHIIITHWLKFIFIKVISTCHVMSLTYEHVLSNQTSYRYANIVQKIVDKKLYVNAKGKNGKVFFKFSMWKQPWWSLFDTMYGIQSSLYLFSYFINHKLYRSGICYNSVNVMWELYAQYARERKCENILWIW